jgi:hypothetical protein
MIQHISAIAHGSRHARGAAAYPQHARAKALARFDSHHGSPPHHWSAASIARKTPQTHSPVPIRRKKSLASISQSRLPMAKTAWLFLVACLLAGAAACAPLANVKPTMEKTRSVSLPNETLFQAALAYAKQQGWTIDSSEQGLGWIEAVSKVDDSSGMTTRERWIVSTRDREIGIQLRLEFLERGKWRSIDLVCNGYSYFRENQHLSAISELGRSTSVASASTGHQQ